MSARPIACLTSSSKKKLIFARFGSYEHLLRRPEKETGCAFSTVARAGTQMRKRTQESL